jgi:hypothetical protein
MHNLNMLHDYSISGKKWDRNDDSFLSIAPCSPYMNQRFGSKYYFYNQGGTEVEQ